MNRVELIGRLTKDPELKTTGSGKVITLFTLATQRNYKNSNGEYEADFINCQAFEKRAETLKNYCKKGDMLGIAGRIQTGSYEDNDGNKRYTTTVIADEFQFLSSKTKEEKPEDNKKTFEDFANEMEITDNDLPF